MPFEAGAEDAWHSFANKLGLASSDVEVSPLRLYALARNSLSPHYTGHRIDVSYAGLSARSESYSMGAVTGIDFEVQAVLVTQRVAIEILSTAWIDIHDNDLQEYAFICDHGTHRSVGCCMLLASIAFPSAEICLSTPRTQRAATTRGMDSRPMVTVR